MPNLGDYIGQVMAEITLARVQADLEAVRLADYYANHPLLSTFPVPRFRLPTVRLDFPVAITAVQPPRNGKGLNLAEARKIFATVLEEELDVAGVKLTTAEDRSLSAALRKRWEGLKAPDFVSTSTVHVADVATNAAEEALSTRVLKGAERTRFVTSLRKRARVALLKLCPRRYG
jgi:hypothetical protein